MHDTTKPHTLVTDRGVMTTPRGLMAVARWLVRHQPRVATLDGIVVDDWRVWGDSPRAVAEGLAQWLTGGAQ